MFFHTLLLRARKALAAALAFSLFASSTPALAANLWWCGLTSSAFETAANWSTTPGCAADGTAPGVADVAIFSLESGGKISLISTATNVKGLIMAKGYTGSVLARHLLGVGTSGMRIGSGRFLNTTYPVTLSGSYTQTGGIVRFQDNFTVSGSLSITRGGVQNDGVIGTGSPYGIFTATGTLTMGGARADQTFSIGNNIIRNIKNLTIKNRGGGVADDVIVTESGGLTVSGALTITLGNLHLGSNNAALTVERGITIADDSQASLSTDQNITASGTILVNDSGVLTVSGGTLTLNDDGDQAVDLDGQRIFNFTINNTGASGNNDVVFAGGALHMSGALTVTLGSLDLASNSLAAVIKGLGITVADNAEATFEGGGNVTMSGSLSTGAAGTFSMEAASTLKLNGVFSNIDTNNAVLYALTVNSASGSRLTSPVRVYNTLTIGTGATLSMVSFTLNATGATINNFGTIKESSGKIVHSGSILITTAAYSVTSEIFPPTPAFFQLTDSDENISGTSADTVSITVTLGSDSEVVTLTETSLTSGVFQGSIVTANAVNSAGVLASQSAGTITSTFTDSEDALAHSDTAAYTIFVASSGGSSGTSGGGSGGGGGGGGRSYLKLPAYTTPAVQAAPSVNPMTPTMVDGMARREIAEKAKVLRLEKRQRAQALRVLRLNARKAKRGL